MFPLQNLARKELKKYLSTWTCIKYFGLDVQVPNTFEFQKAKYQ